MPDLAAVHQGLKSKNVTLALLREEYVQATAGPTYQYSRFCDLYRDFAKGLKRSMRQVHRAGEKLFIDYAGDTVPIVDAETGEISRAQIFVAVLGASNYTFACATATQSQADWLGGAGAGAADSSAACPSWTSPTTPAPWSANRTATAPQLQRTTAEFAQHCRRPGDPARTPLQAAGQEQGGGGRTDRKRWILARLRHRRFFGRPSSTWPSPSCSKIYARPFQRLPGIVAAPSRRSTSRRCVRCPPRRSSSPSGRRPSPTSTITSSSTATTTACPTRWSGRCWSFASRSRASSASPADAAWRCMPSDRRGAFSTLTEHMPASHQAHRQWSPSKLIAWGATAGPHTERVVAFQLERMPHPEEGYRACLGLSHGPPSRQRTAGGRRHPAPSRSGRCATRTSPRCSRPGSIAHRCPASAQQQAELALPDAHANLRGAHYYH